MTIREVMHHRAVRVVIGIPLVVISTIAMLNPTHIDGTLLAFMLFVIVNITHLFCDKLWSWFLVMPFFVAYIVLLWINFFRDYHLLGSKYLVDEYIYIQEGQSYNKFELQQSYNIEFFSFSKSKSSIQTVQNNLHNKMYLQIKFYIFLNFFTIY